MSAVVRLFCEWIEDTDEVYDIDGKYDKADLQAAYEAGWSARHNAYWESSEIPMIKGDGDG